MRTRNTIQRIWIIIIMSFVGIYTYGQDTIQVLQKSCKYTFVIPEGWDTIPRSVLMQKLPGYSIDAGLYPLQQQEYFKGNYILINFLPTIKTLNGFPFKQIEEDLVKMNEKSLLPNTDTLRVTYKGTESKKLDGDEALVQATLDLLTGDVEVADVDEHEVVVGAAGDQTEAFSLQTLGKNGSVLDDLLTVGLELGLERLAEADGLGSDDVLERAALGAGEHGGVDLLGQVDGLHLAGLDVLLGDLVLAQDHAAAGTAQGLVGGGGDNVGIGHGALVNASGDETGDVGHIDHEESADGISDLTELGEVDLAGIGGSAGKDHLGLALLRDAVDLVVVDHFGLIVEGVGDLMEVLAGDVDRAAVGQVAAVGEVHAHEGVAGLEHSLERGQVGGSAGVGLDVGMLSAEQLAGALTGDLFGLVDAVAAAVVALAGIALGVLVGQARAHSHHDSRGDDVFGGDQLDVALLAVILLLNSGADFGVILGQEFHGFFDHGACSSSDFSVD